MIEMLVLLIEMAFELLYAYRQLAEQNEMLVTGP